LFKMMTGVTLVRVPYRGAGPALVDLLGGQVQVMFATMSSSIEYVRGGKLRALAVTTATRSPVLPDRKTRPPRLSTSSTRRSTQLSPIPR
jgi:tripartite-type tricarboxylate transporter receptor subunit TctC